MKTIFILLFTITVLGSQAQTWTTKILSEKMRAVDKKNADQDLAIDALKSQISVLKSQNASLQQQINSVKIIADNAATEASKKTYISLTKGQLTGVVNKDTTTISINNFAVLSAASAIAIKASADVEEVRLEIDALKFRIANLKILNPVIQ